VPPDILAEVEAAEKEAEAAVVVPVDAPVPSELPRGPGRPPKGKCADCGKPLARGRVCPCVLERLEQRQPSRPAWEPLPIEDLRQRLELLTQADVESYEDGQLKIQRNTSSRGMRVVRGERTSSDGSKW